jgi:hypothetical protein
MGLRWVAVVGTAAVVAGCGGERPRTDADLLVEAYKQFITLASAGDGKNMWEMFSAGEKAENTAALDELKKLGDAELGKIATQLGTSISAIRAADGPGMLSLVWKSRFADPKDSKRLRGLGIVASEVTGERGKAWAAADEGRFGLGLQFVRENGVWKVDQMDEEEREVREVGK